MQMIPNQLEGQTTIYQYMKPEYWDGNRIGIDAVPCGPYVPYDHTRFVRRAIAGYLDRADIGGLRPEKKIGWGQEYNADDHPPGTVLAIKREKIAVEWGSRYWSEIDRLTVPEKPSLAVDVADYGHIHHRDRGSYGYETNLAVVTPPSEGHQAIVSAALLIRGSLNGARRTLIWPARQIPRSFTVGKVYGKYEWPRNGEDSAFKRRYIRVLGAEVLGTYGKKQPKRVLDLLGILKPADISGSA